MADLPAAPSLSPRLEQLLDLAAKGVPDKAIASELGISPHTVDSSWRRLREAFGSANRAETIARYAETRTGRQVADLCAQVEALEREVETLRQANARLTAVLEARDTSTVRWFEEGARAALVDVAERDQLRQLKQAVESSDTIFYEGEIGGLWRKHWATENCARFGFSAAAFVSGAMRIADLVPPQDMLAVMNAFERALTEGLSSLVTFYRVRHSDESYRWVRDRMTIVRDANGEAVRYYGCATDVTDMAAHCDPALLLYPAP